MRRAFAESPGGVPTRSSFEMPSSGRTDQVIEATVLSPDIRNFTSRPSG